jgi:hypothetical protein
MIAQPTDGLLVGLAAVRAANLDLRIIKRAFGDGASLSEKAKVNSMALSSTAVHRYRRASDSDLKHSRRATG